MAVLFHTFEHPETAATSAASSSGPAYVVLQNTSATKTGCGAEEHLNIETANAEGLEDDDADTEVSSSMSKITACGGEHVELSEDDGSRVLMAQAQLHRQGSSCSLGVSSSFFLSQ